MSGRGKGPPLAFIIQSRACNSKDDKDAENDKNDKDC